MEKLIILLCCGAGMSSGFLAQRGRVAAKKKGLDVKIDARSESEVAQYLSKIDILMIGPHYAGALARFQTMAKPYGVPVVVIPKPVYAGLDGEGLINLALAESKRQEA